MVGRASPVSQERRRSSGTRSLAAAASRRRPADWRAHTSSSGLISASGVRAIAVVYMEPTRDPRCLARAARGAPLPAKRESRGADPAPREDTTVGYVFLSRLVQRHPPARQPRRAVRLEIGWLHSLVLSVAQHYRCARYRFMPWSLSTRRLRYQVPSAGERNRSSDRQGDSATAGSRYAQGGLGVLWGSM